jgi:peroxin-1
LTSDETDPKTKSAVLANADTEVFVAPRPRKEDGAKEQSRVIEPVASNPSSGSRKGKERAQVFDGVSCRFVPPRVAAKWGDLGLSEGDLESVGSEAVVLCSSTTSRRIRRKSGKEGQNRLYVKLNKRREDEKPIDGEGNEAETTDEKADAEGPGGWLTVWDEMPEGCVSVTGQLDQEWAEWCTVQ